MLGCSPARTRRTSASTHISMLRARRRRPSRRVEPCRDLGAQAHRVDRHRVGRAERCFAAVELVGLRCAASSTQSVGVERRARAAASARERRRGRRRGCRRSPGSRLRPSSPGLHVDLDEARRGAGSCRSRRSSRAACRPRAARRPGTRRSASRGRSTAGGRRGSCRGPAGGVTTGMPRSTSARSSAPRPTTTRRCRRRSPAAARRASSAAACSTSPGAGGSCRALAPHATRGHTTRVVVDLGVDRGRSRSRGTPGRVVRSSLP